MLVFLILFICYFRTANFCSQFFFIAWTHLPVNFLCQGIWPAHWMMPQDDSCDPDEGEMDIMEMVSGDGMAWSTYHWQSNWPAESCAYPDGHLEVTIK